MSARLAVDEAYMDCGHVLVQRALQRSICNTGIVPQSTKFELVRN